MVNILFPFIFKACRTYTSIHVYLVLSTCLENTGQSSNEDLYHISYRTNTKKPLLVRPLLMKSGHQCNIFKPHRKWNGSLGPWSSLTKTPPTPLHLWLVLVTLTACLMFAAYFLKNTANLIYEPLQPPHSLPPNSSRNPPFLGTTLFPSPLPISPFSLCPFFATFYPSPPSNILSPGLHRVNISHIIPLTNL